MGQTCSKKTIKSVTGIDKAVTEEDIIIDIINCDSGVILFCVEIDLTTNDDTYYIEKKNEIVTYLNDIDNENLFVNNVLYIMTLIEIIKDNKIKYNKKITDKQHKFIWLLLLIMQDVSRKLTQLTEKPTFVVTKIQKTPFIDSFINTSIDFHN